MASRPPARRGHAHHRWGGMRGDSVFSRIVVTDGASFLRVVSGPGARGLVLARVFPVRAASWTAYAQSES